MSHISDGEFPDDELTDISYMLESNDNYSELFADLKNEDDGEGTKIRIGKKVVLLARVVKALQSLRSQDETYPAEFIDGNYESLLEYL